MATIDDDLLAQLLAVSTDSTAGSGDAGGPLWLASNDGDTGAAVWSDVSSAEWDQLLRALENGQRTRTDSDATPATSDTDQGSDPPSRSCQSQRYRKRKRLELLQLRGEAAASEAQLRELMAARHATQSKTSTTRQEAVALAWRRIAMHQKAARREVEAENMRLKTALRRQLDVARRLQKLFQRRHSTDDLRDSIDHKRQRRQRSVEISVSLFVQLSNKLPPCLTGVDSMLEEVGYATYKNDVERVRACTDRGSSVEVELLFAKVFPFDREMTQNSVWQCCGAIYTPACGHEDAFSAFSYTDAQIEMAFCLPMSIRHCDGQVDAQVVMRRFKEESRTVQWYEGVWTLRCTNPAYDGVTLRDRGWHVIEDLAVDKDHPSAKASSIVQCFSRIELDVAKLSQPEDIAIVREELLNVYNQKQQNSFRMFETALVEQIVFRERNT